jgi:hypothetical protein
MKGEKSSWVIREQGVEEDIWAQVEGANRSLEKKSHNQGIYDLQWSPSGTRLKEEEGRYKQE